MYIRGSLRCERCKMHKLVRSSLFPSDHSAEHSSSSKSCDWIVDGLTSQPYGLANATAHGQPQDGRTSGISEWADAIMTQPDQQVTDDEGGSTGNVASDMQVWVPSSK
jgi:hypothetical protein